MLSRILADIGQPGDAGTCDNGVVGGAGDGAAGGAVQAAAASTEAPTPIRVAYTLEQCWHPVPGGTARAALKIAAELAGRSEIQLHQVAGRHALVPTPEFRPVGKVAMLPLARPLLYEAWTRLGWPRVESVIGPIDVAHATGLVPCASSAPLVVTLHDLAFLHDPAKFSKHGVRVMTRSLEVIKRRADRVLCPSQATIADCLAAGLDESRLRLVPLGVDKRQATPFAIERVRRQYDLPDEFVLFVGTLEPRKNLQRLVDAMAHRQSGQGARSRQALVVAGAPGWGESMTAPTGVAVRFLGFVPDRELGALYGAASVFAYPSEREGFGLPVAEAMAQGTAVVTSAGTSTEEVAGGAAVLVDPFDVASIATGLDDANDRRAELSERSLRRVGELGWDIAADRTIAVYRELVPAGGGGEHT
jgi:glycosyltransferase involved in cell wall biosynthesis